MADESQIKNNDTSPLVLERENPGELDFIYTENLPFLSHAIYEAAKLKGSPKLSVCVLGFKRPEKTKRCVESILRFIGDIDYELLLLDNGSCDGGELCDYFQSIESGRKRIIRTDEPIGIYYGSINGLNILIEHARGDFIVYINNDHIITENAIQNILLCLESSPDIGAVVPMSSSAILHQDPGFTFSSIDEIFDVAKDFNKHDPRKWEERLVLASVVMGMRRSAVISAGAFDTTAEWGFCKRLRDMGYKTLLLGDTYVFHDHDYETETETHGYVKTGNGDMSACVDRLFERQAYGLNKFSDIMRFERVLSSLLKCEHPSGKPSILALDVKSGQGLLDLKNKLRTFGVFETESAAFTTDAKYYGFLRTAADTVFCDRIEYIGDHIDGMEFDYIIVGNHLNTYAKPFELLRKMLKHLKKGGQMLFKLRNTADIQMLETILKQRLLTSGEMIMHITAEDIFAFLRDMGYNKVSIRRSRYPHTQITDEMTSLIVEYEKNIGSSGDRIMVYEYLISVINT